MVIKFFKKVLLNSKFYITEASIAWAEYVFIFCLFFNVWYCAISFPTGLWLSTKQSEILVTLQGESNTHHFCLGHNALVRLVTFWLGLVNILPFKNLWTSLIIYRYIFTFWHDIFIGYINYAMIKLLIYFNSHMPIDELIINIIPKYLYRTVVHTNIKMLILFLSYCYYNVVWYLPVCPNEQYYSINMILGRTFFPHIFYI